MIYLFDDSILRGINYLDYTDCLCVINQLSPEQLTRMEPALSKAECILIHKSFRDLGGQSADVLDRVCNDIAEYGDHIPFVMFSDGDIANRPVVEGPSFISSLKKSELYSRLPSFLESFRATGTITLSLLVNESSPDIQNAIVLGKAILDNPSIRFAGNDTCLDLRSESIPDIIRFINATSPGIRLTPDGFQDMLSRGLKMGRLKNNLRMCIVSMSKYGQNLHCWE